MLNIKAYQEESFDFYRSVVDSKRSEVVRRELGEVYDRQFECFNAYDLAFPLDQLGDMEPAGYTEQHKQLLKSLYTYRSIKIQRLRDFLIRHPNFDGHSLSKCQYCTINEADTMDHILGQTAFPEFAVHPKNLIPCCSFCNRKKSESYQNEEGLRLFLNLYLDDLPSSQYLYVEFGRNWLPRFFLSKPDDVSDELFAIIDSHYARLNLLERFQKSSIEEISELKLLIQMYGDKVKDKVDEHCDEIAPMLGYNHRKLVIHRALFSSEEFTNQCLGY